MCRFASRLYIAHMFIPVAPISEGVAESRPLTAVFITSKVMCRAPISTTISHRSATVSNYAHFKRGICL